MDDLKPQVLEERERSSNTLVISALRGLGGIGKSTLAAALALEPEVRFRFPDGVLWATLGQQPDLLSLLSGWVQELVRTLGDDAARTPPQATTIAAATNQLRSLLHERAALLIVDDVWNAEDARPFLSGGPRCRVLVTTRRADIADDVGARRFELDVMTPEQSLALLASRMDRPLAGEEAGQAARLARSVGYLPLALELAAARVLRGVSWDDLRSAFEQEVARLDALEGPRRPSRSQISLQASFNLSLDALRAEDDSVWEAFVWLGVLPEDVTISAPMAATLWDRNEAEAAELLEWLWNDALLLPGPAVLVGQRQWPGYRLHDLLHDMARRLLTAPEPEGLGLSLPQAHAYLLSRYQTRCGGKDTSGSAWHRLADDGYIYGRLVWHMAEAGQFEAIVALLREETMEGRNAWFAAREGLGQTAGFLEDVARAWRLTEARSEQCIAQEKPAEAVGLEARFALMTTSINSLAANIPAALLKALVQHRVWSPAQGLAYAQRTPDRQQRAEALAGIAEYLPEPQKQQALDQALAAARAITDELHRAQALAGIAPYLARTGQTDQALAIARSIRNKPYRTRAMEGIVPYLARMGQADIATTVVRVIKDDFYRAWALASIAEHLPESMLTEALAAARSIRNHSCRAQALAGITPYLPDLMLTEALAIARSIEGESERAQALAGIAEHLPEPQKQQALDQALATARAVEDEYYRAQALAKMIPHLPEPQKQQVLDQALAVVRSIRNKPYRAQALASVAEHLPEPQKQQALDQALAAARAVEDEYYRAQALAGIAPYLARMGQTDQALAIARSIEGESYLSQVLAGIAPYLPESMQAEALAIARSIRNKPYRTRAMEGIAPYLARMGQTDQALAVARSIEGESERAQALAGIAEHLPEPQKQQALDQALATARAVEDEYYRAQALAGIAEHLPEPQKQQALDQALAAARAIAGEHSRVLALARITPYLPEPMLTEALAAARAVQDESQRAYALAGIAEHLPEPQKQEALNQALATARSIKDKPYRAQALAVIAPYLARTGQTDQALAMTRAIRDNFHQAWALAEMIPHLPEPQKQQALDQALVAARAIAGEHSRVQALLDIAEYIARTGQTDQALVVARAITDELHRAQALARVAARSAQQTPATLYSLWKEILQDLAAGSRRDLLEVVQTRFVGVIAQLGGAGALAEVAQAIEDVGRWWP